MIRVDRRNPKAVERGRELATLLDLNALPERVCIVLGGDGHMLSVIHDQGPDWTYVGLNCGRVGFLLNEAENLKTFAKAIQDGAYDVREVPRLLAVGTTRDGEEVRGVALNDVYLERMTGQTAHLRVLVDGIEVVERLVCDGLIVSTAVGSTAYSLAAGGPACHTSLRLLALVAIAAHTPRLPPILLPPETRVSVQVHSARHRPVRMVCDGRDHDDVVSVEVADSGSAVRLAFLEHHNPTTALMSKLT